MGFRVADGKVVDLLYFEIEPTSQENASSGRAHHRQSLAIRRRRYADETVISLRPWRAGVERRRGAANAVRVSLASVLGVAAAKARRAGGKRAATRWRRQDAGDAMGYVGAAHPSVYSLPARAPTRACLPRPSSHPPLPSAFASPRPRSPSTSIVASPGPQTQLRIICAARITYAAHRLLRQARLAVRAPPTGAARQGALLPSSSVGDAAELQPERQGVLRRVHRHADPSATRAALSRRGGGDEL